MTDFGPGEDARLLTPDAEIVCVDCGGACYPLGWHSEDGPVEPGTVIAYRCRDCLDRWDIVISADDHTDHRFG